MESIIKDLSKQRERLDSLKVGLSKFPRSRGQALSYTALEKGRMYIGEVLLLLGSPYPYEKTKTAVTTSDIDKSVNLGDNVSTFLIKDNEIVNINDMCKLLEAELEEFISTVYNPNNAIHMSSTIESTKCSINIIEAYTGLKEARMWLGVRLGEIRDTATKTKA